MRKLYLSLLALFLCVGSFAQQNDSVYVYSKGQKVRSFLRSKIDSITYSKTGVDNKAYTDYVTQVIAASGENYKLALSTIDSLTLGHATVHETPGQAVDLGLSVKWANYNVGATTPEEFGGYFAWGETSEKEDCTWDTYIHYDKKNGVSTDIGKNISGTQYDVARQRWGGKWRMPTYEEVEELIGKCKAEWTTSNGVSGYELTGPSGNKIFLPAAGVQDGTSKLARGEAGFYWSATWKTRDDSYVIALDSQKIISNYSDRCGGLPIRPVTE